MNPTKTPERQFTAQSALLIDYQKATARYARALFNLANKMRVLSPGSAEHFPFTDGSRALSQSTENPSDRHAA